MNLNSGPTIRAEIDYDSIYRFRLWLAAVEDSSLLQKGHNAYHSHILESIDFWAKTGTRFFNSRGGQLRPDILKADDLFGFLGPKENTDGPARKIDAGKFGVLDAFFKRKYPELAKSFPNSQNLVQLTALLKGFFWERGHVNSSPLKKIQLEDFCNNGVFILAHSKPSRPRYLDLDYDDLRRLYTVAYTFKRRSSGSVVVHRLSLALQRDDILNGSALMNEVEQRPSLLRPVTQTGMTIWGGVAFPLQHAESDETLSMACVLRDRATYRPHLSHIGFERLNVAKSPRGFDKQIGMYEFSIGDIFDKLIFIHYDPKERYTFEPTNYNDNYIEYIINTCKLIGFEV